MRFSYFWGLWLTPAPIAQVLYYTQITKNSNIEFLVIQDEKAFDKEEYNLEPVLLCV